LNKVGVGGVKRLELAIRTKIEQRTAGGPMALRKAFKYFDSDASGDIDPDEFFSAMHAFGLEFTEDQVLALYGYYDVDRDGGLSYYEFIEKVMDSGFGNENEEKILAEPMMLEVEEVGLKSILTKQDLDVERAKKLFRKYDANNSGEIDMREIGILIKSLGLNMGAEEINNAMVDLDKDRNGAISFDEFWDWFQSASTVKVGMFGSSQTPARSGSLKLKTGVRDAVKGLMKNEQDTKISEDHDAQVASINRRPMTAMSRPSTAFSRNGSPSPSKVGSWVTRNSAGTPTLDDTARHLAGRIRPSTAMGRSDADLSSSGSRTNYHIPRESRPWGADGWRSISRSDFKPHVSKLTPPRLNLPPNRGDRPMSAQPLIRTPGAPQAPVGSTSGFRL